MRVAIVHDFLNQAGGAERVVAHLHRIFPAAPIFTAIVDRAVLWPELRDADIRTTWMQHLPLVQRHHRVYLPLYPSAIEGIDLTGFDLVISSSSAFAKGAIRPQGAAHLCYCHSPMRFVWDRARYAERERFGVGMALLHPVLDWLQRWDVASAQRPDHIVVNSTAVAERVRRCWGRESTVLFPPVDVERYRPLAENGGYYLVVSRLVGYKRVDLAVRAFAGLPRRLVVVGDGPDRRALERLAGANVRFTGRLSDAEVAGHYARCRALVFPGEEDFGLTPLEANASGRPVIAYGAGGARDTVIDGETGVFFPEASPEALREAVLRQERIAWDKLALRGHAERFSAEAFRTGVLTLVDRLTRLAARALGSPAAVPVPLPLPQ